VWMSGEFKSAYVQNDRGAGGSLCSGPAIPYVR
jgi:hypothetical protein